jgi:hypothetical protein
MVFFASSLEQEIHDLVDELPDDSPLLIVVRESVEVLRKALQEMHPRRTASPVNA